MAGNEQDQYTGPSFEDFISDAKWDSFESYLEVGQTVLRNEIQRNVNSENEIRKRLRERLTQKYSNRLRSASDSQLNLARERLRTDCVAIDGTRAQVQLLSGIRSQLGVVAITYDNDRWSYVTYVTELTYRDFDLTQDIEQLVDSRAKEDRAVSDLVIRGMLQYNERLRATEQPRTWRIVHGELFPFELRSGLGKLEALDVATALFRRLEQIKTVGAIVSDTTSAAINYGYALEPGEYFKIADLKYEYDQWLDGGAKFNPEDKAKFRRFNDEVAINILKGVFRVGSRPFLFYAHKDHFDEIASILIADSLAIPERGFPLLVDYADTVCANLFRAGDFERRVFHELALEGDQLAEQSERASRAR